MSQADVVVGVCSTKPDMAHRHFFPSTCGELNREPGTSQMASDDGHSVKFRNKNEEKIAPQT
jgi:hypothetical protein